MRKTISILFVALILAFGAKFVVLHKAKAFEEVEEPSFSESESFSGEEGESSALHSSFDDEEAQSEEENDSYKADDEPSSYSTPYNNFFMTYWPVWLILSEQQQQEEKNNDTVNVHDHFPYIISVDKTAHTYQVYRYIGAHDKNEVVSPQEAAGLSWLQGEINY